MKVNYIRHVNAFFAEVQKDNRLCAHHISLYMALFQVWNRHHFKKSFPILREEVIRLCRIGSMNTYTRCLKELHSYGYICYQQGKMTLPGIVMMLPLPGADEETEQLLLFDEGESTPAPPALTQVQEFFSASAYPATEAGKFFRHYTANGWKQGGKTPITNWQAAAYKWMLNINPHITITHDRNTKQSNLHVNENKSYSEPL